MKRLSRQVVLSESAEDTMALGSSMAAVLPPGMTVLLIGALGAGKTTLVRGVCERLGCGRSVRSPSFTLVHEYRTDDGRLVVHADLYRLSGGDVDDLELESYIDDGALLFVEWADRGAIAERGQRWTIRFDPSADEEYPSGRVLSFSSEGEEGRASMEAFLDHMHTMEADHGLDPLG